MRKWKVTVHMLKGHPSHLSHMHAADMAAKRRTVYSQPAGRVLIEQLQVVAPSYGMQLAHVYAAGKKNIFSFTRPSENRLCVYLRCVVYKSIY